MASSPRLIATARCERCTRTCNGRSPTPRSNAAAFPSHCCRMCGHSMPTTSTPISMRRFIGRARGSRFTSRPSSGGCMREVIPTPVPGLDLRREYGHHQSPAIRAGGMVFCSGMVAIDPQSGERQHGTVTSEARRIFVNLKLLLEPAGLSLDRLVHAMIYDRIEYDVLNRLYRQYVPNAPPARTVMSVQIEAGFKVMLDVIAAAETRQPAAMTYPRQVIEPGGWRRPATPLSPAIRAGEFVFLSGMTATDPTAGTPAPGTVAAETRQILTNMGELLETAGSSLAKVVKVNALIYSMLEYDNMNSVYREFFPVDPPARTVDRKSTRLNSSHVEISYAVFCLKKKKNMDRPDLFIKKKKKNQRTT